MATALSIKGRKFNRLTAIRKTWFRYDGCVVWLFECDCGNKTLKAAKKVKLGAVKSCGCISTENAMRNVAKLTRHGHRGKNPSPTYISWRSMKQRSKDKDKQYYGIDICNSWQVFGNFLEDMGERPYGKTLDRIDNSIGYSKENCRWATYTDQTKNRKNTVMVEYKGEIIPLSQITRELGLNYRRTWERITYRGLSIEDCIRKDLKCQDQ